MAYDVHNKIDELYLGFQLVGWPEYKKRVDLEMKWEVLISYVEYTR